MPAELGLGLRDAPCGLGNWSDDEEAAAAATAAAAAAAAAASPTASFGEDVDPGELGNPWAAADAFTGTDTGIAAKSCTVKYRNLNGG